MTPHNNGEQSDHAEAVVLPGDPHKAKWIADNFFEEAPRAALYVAVDVAWQPYDMLHCAAHS